MFEQIEKTADQLEKERELWKFVFEDEEEIVNSVSTDYESLKENM